MANRVEDEIQVNRCQYCGTEFITVENYGRCRKGCPGNCVELWSQKCGLPKDVEEKILQRQPKTVSLCVGCKAVDCSQRSEIGGIVTVCAMRQGAKHLSADLIVGDLITRVKYRFVNHALVAEVVRDVMAIVEQAVRERRKCR